MRQKTYSPAVILNARFQKIYKTVELSWAGGKHYNKQS